MGQRNTCSCKKNLVLCSMPYYGSWLAFTLVKGNLRKQFCGSGTQFWCKVSG